MSVVVRVKRSLNDEPLDALVLSCKRRKTSAESDDSITAIFKFAGTVKSQDEDIKDNLPQILSKEGAKELSKPSINVLKKSRLEAKAQSQSSRYKLVNHFRALSESQLSIDGDKEEKSQQYTVLDVEPHSENLTSKAGSSKANEKDASDKDKSNFVYDVYHREPDNEEVDVDDLLLDGIVSINPLDAELVYDSYRGHKAQDADSESDNDNEDEDSNDENNWRNDYPDEDEMNSDNDDLINDIERVMIGDEELSSDGEEYPVYDDKLKMDELFFGSKYAEYKRRMMQELHEEASDYSSKSSRSSSCSNLSGLELGEGDE